MQDIKRGKKEGSVSEEMEFPDINVLVEFSDKFVKRFEVFPISTSCSAYDRD